MKKKILISYNFILHYREDFFELLNEFYDVTVLHSGQPPANTEHSYSIIHTNVMKLGPFYLQQGLFNTYYKNQFDAVILLFDLRWLNVVVFLFFRRILRLKCKVITWGSWKTNKRIVDAIRYWFMCRVDANIFYCDAAKLAFLKLGLPEHKAFVANNTFKVEIDVPCYLNSEKDSLLFVGSLDERKRNSTLLSAFAASIPHIPEKIRLVFIGDGPERLFLEDKVKRLGIINRVQFLGRINNPKELVKYYNKAICTVSYGQAGLSVLQSMGFGVPFMTLKNAVSGGEITNIKNEHNGVLLDAGLDALKRQLIRICNDEDWARSLGRNAYQYYQKNCKLEHMVQGFVEAIENKGFLASE